jgi:uncharacterized protein (TIGR02118 family)
MAAHVLVLYNQPTDPAAFEAYYFGTHVPIAKRIPKLRSYTVNRGQLAPAGGTTPYFLVAILAFDSMADVQTGMTSPEGVAAGADVANFATGGASILMYETQEV